MFQKPRAIVEKLPHWPTRTFEQKVRVFPAWPANASPNVLGKVFVLFKTSWKPEMLIAERMFFLKAKVPSAVLQANPRSF